MTPLALPVGAGRGDVRRGPRRVAGHDQAVDRRQRDGVEDEDAQIPQARDESRRAQGCGDRETGQVAFVFFGLHVLRLALPRPRGEPGTQPAGLVAGRGWRRP